MRWRHLLIVALAATFMVGPAPGPVTTPPAGASPVREIQSGRISALIPERWDFRSMSFRSPASQGIQASTDLSREGSFRQRDLGLEAYWVDAAQVGLPSDYYYLAAEGRARHLPAERGCRRARYDVIRNREPAFNRAEHSPGDYMATAGGTCAANGRRLRWASFVAAPGFGPVKRLGIPESGLYYAMVVIPDGPHAHQRAGHLLSSVQFDDTPVKDLIAAARRQM